jgi:hypothetical protein
MYVQLTPAIANSPREEKVPRAHISWEVWHLCQLNIMVHFNSDPLKTTPTSLQWRAQSLGLVMPWRTVEIFGALVRGPIRMRLNEVS